MSQLIYKNISNFVNNRDICWRMHLPESHYVHLVRKLSSMREIRNISPLDLSRSPAIVTWCSIGLTLVRYSLRPSISSMYFFQTTPSAAGEARMKSLTHARARARLELFSRIMTFVTNYQLRLYWEVVDPRRKFNTRIETQMKAAGRGSKRVIKARELAHLDMCARYTHWLL